MNHFCRHLANEFERNGSSLVILNHRKLVILVSCSYDAGWHQFHRNNLAIIDCLLAHDLFVFFWWWHENIYVIFLDISVK